MGSCLSKKGKRARANEHDEVSATRGATFDKSSHFSTGDVGEIKEDDLRNIFAEFDLNGDGFIQVSSARIVVAARRRKCLLTRFLYCLQKDELRAVM